MAILELKNTMMKKLRDGVNSRIEGTEKWIHELEDRKIGISQSEP